MCHKSERLLKEWWWTLKIFEELARDNIVNIVNYGIFHGGLNLWCRLIWWFGTVFGGIKHEERCFIMYSFEFVKAFFFFNSFHCIPYNKDNQLIIYSIEFVKSFFLFIVSLTNYNKDNQLKGEPRKRHASLVSWLYLATIWTRLNYKRYINYPYVTYKVWLKVYVLHVSQILFIIWSTNLFYIHNFILRKLIIQTFD